jgi:hypothetical protein
MLMIWSARLIARVDGAPPLFDLAFTFDREHGALSLPDLEGGAALALAREPWTPWYESWSTANWSCWTPR